MKTDLLHAPCLCLMTTMNMLNDLTSDEKIDQFFKTVFPDFHSLMPNLIENWAPASTFVSFIVRCYPLTMGKLL